MHFLFLGLFILAFIVCIVGEIMLIVAAFRVSVVWGLCVLFLGPAQFIFLIMHWEEAKKAFGITMVGVLLGFASILSGMGSAGPAMEGLAEKLAASGVAEEHLEALHKMAEDQNTGSEEEKKAEPEEMSKLSEKDPTSFEGATLTEVKEQLGRPKGEMESGGEKCLLYDKFTVFSADGETVSHIEMSAGKVGGQTKGRRRKTAPVASMRGNQTSAVTTIKNGGQRIDIKKVLVPGKIMVVDFYADWCAPCKRMGPELEQIARSDPDVALCKIDIVNWKTPVVKQFGIRSIPNVRVFDRNGAAVGSPTSGMGEVKQNIERAR